MSLKKNALILMINIKNQIGRYAVAGLWNTVFGYAVYAVFVAVLTGKMPYAYLVAGVISNVVAVTQSFFVYKFFVFKTQGNIWHEYLKCWAVYGTGVAVNLAGLPFAVMVCEAVLPPTFVVAAPYVGGAVMTGVVVLFSFFGHKKITFKT